MHDHTRMNTNTPDITIHGPTSSGSFNVFGMADGSFFLQGNLTYRQLEDLYDAVAGIAKPECNVYDSLLPRMRTAIANLTDDPADTDEIEVRGILEAAVTALEGLDTTVRETY